MQRDDPSLLGGVLMSGVVLQSGVRVSPGGQIVLECSDTALELNVVLDGFCGEI
jgi:hypothetical protein